MSLSINPNGGFTGINSSASSAGTGVYITGNTYVSGNLFVSGNTYFTNLEVLGNSYAASLSLLNANITGNIILSTCLNLSGNLKVSANVNASNVIVTGNANISSNITMKNLNAPNVTCLNLFASNFIFQTGNILVPTGSIMMWMSTTPPLGYLNCNGAVVSSITYKSLYSVIGTTFNGTGTFNNTFTLPDFKDVIPYGVSTYTIGQRSAQPITNYPNVTLSASNLPPHIHSVSSITDSTHVHTNPSHSHVYYMSSYDQQSFLIQGKQQGATATTSVELKSSSHNRQGTLSDMNTTETSQSTTTQGYISADIQEVSWQAGNIDIRNPYIGLNFIIKY